MPDDTAIVSDTRKRVNGRQFALRTYHPDVGRVDQETFWKIWRDGYNAFAQDSASLNELFRSVAEKILIMSQAQDAAPPTFAAIAIQLIRESRPMDGKGAWVAVPLALLQRLSDEVDPHK